MGLPHHTHASWRPACQLWKLILHHEGGRAALSPAFLLASVSISWKIRCAAAAAWSESLMFGSVCDVDTRCDAIVHQQTLNAGRCMVIQELQPENVWRGGGMGRLTASLAPSFGASYFILVGKSVLIAALADAPVSPHSASYLRTVASVCRACCYLCSMHLGFQQFLTDDSSALCPSAVKHGIVPPLSWVQQRWGYTPSVFRTRGAAFTGRPPCMCAGWVLCPPWDSMRRMCCCVSWRTHTPSTTPLWD